MAQLIGLLGKKGSGKDTLASKLKEKGYQQYAFADPLKRGIQQFFDLSEEQLYDEVLKETIDERWGVSPRMLFQIIGTEIFQHGIHEHLNLKVGPTQHWTFLFEEWYRKQQENNQAGLVVVSDVRFKHELETIKKLGGKIIKIVRPERNHNLDQHSSETYIDQVPTIEIDYLIQNDGTLNQLFLKLDNALEYLQNQ